jgi:hypothetical protein
MRVGVKEREMESPKAHLIGAIAKDLEKVLPLLLISAGRKKCNISHGNMNYWVKKKLNWGR